MNRIRVALAAINSTVGDLDANTDKIIRYMEDAKNLDADIVAFPELAITGYPPEDLLLKTDFITANLECLKDIAAHSEDITVITGFVDHQEDNYNAAAVIHDGEIMGIYHKNYLPNYAIFDEYRYFKQGTEQPVFLINSFLVGINICEDIWYPEGPAMFQSMLGDAQLIININASPYYAGKIHERKRMIGTRAADNKVYIAWTNMVGGQDELIFDGAPMVFDPTGKIIAMGHQFSEDLLIADLDMNHVERVRLHDPRRRMERMDLPLDEEIVPLIEISDEKKERDYQPVTMDVVPPLDELSEIYTALCLGMKDYVKKNGFSQVVIGMSGGIDSTLTAAIAVDALGSGNVTGVLMPSPYTSKTSNDDAIQVCDNLGIRTLTIPIDTILDVYLTELKPVFGETQPDVTEENIQARIRGNLLMALSNKNGWLVLTTGNKSEYAVGYATLYGDMAGGFAVLRDVPKTLVYKLAKYKNAAAGKPVIPQSVMHKLPSAELKENQKDTDSLPPYDVLDPILKAYVEEDRSVQDISDLGFDEELVKKIIGMVDKSEFKRRQAPPGIKITQRAFGKDRRLPIVNKFYGFNE